MEDQNNWNTIESDPGVFNEMVETIGVKDVQFKEIFSLEFDETFDRIKPIEGYVILFEYNKKAIDYFNNEYCLLDLEEYKDIFFAKQIVNNACATQAILSVLMNLKCFELGETLTKFRNETMPMTPLERGKAIGNNKIIRDAHNNFAQPSEVLQKKISEHVPDGMGTCYHFIGIVPYNGILLLLDGLSEAPIVIGTVEENWYKDGIKPFFEGLVNANNNVEFTILAVVHNQINKYQQLIENAEKENNKDMIPMYKEIVEEEEDIRKKERIENRRRKHDYMQLALNSLMLLAKYQKLDGQVEKNVEEIKKGNKK